MTIIPPATLKHSGEEYNKPVMPEIIGTLNEQPLHAGLKEYYANGGGCLEASIEGYFIDVVYGNELIEIQTQNFYSIKQKLIELISKHVVKLVYPVASEKWLLKLPGQKASEAKRRKSPKRGKPCQVFFELVSFPELIKKSNFTLDVVMADVEEVRRYTGEKPWRQNGWQTVEQRLIRVVRIFTIKQPADLISLLPETLPVKFTTSDLQETAQIPRWLAQKAAYCLRKAGTVRLVGKRGRFNLYEQI